MYSQTENKELLRLISKNDEAAFSELFNRYYHKVNSFAFKLTHSGALSEEIVQEVFMKVWINRSSLESIEYFPSYLFAITRNHAINLLKKIGHEKKMKCLLGKEILSGYQEKDSDSEIHIERQRIFSQVLNELPDKQRYVYTLCHQQGLRYEEAAKLLHISKFTVKTHMQHAIRGIKLRLKN